MKTITITPQAARQLDAYAAEQGLQMRQGKKRDDGAIDIVLDDDVAVYLAAIDDNPSAAINMLVTGQVGRA